MRVGINKTQKGGTQLPLKLFVQNFALVILFTVQLSHSFSSALPTNHVENYSWSFAGGNLLTNWSFESLTEEMCPLLGYGTIGSYGTETDCHHEIEFPRVAKSGQRVLHTTFKNDGDPTFPEGIPPVSQISQRLPVIGGTTYRLSFYFKTNQTEKIPARAQVCWASQTKILNCKNGDLYSDLVPGLEKGKESDWTLYSMEFTPDAEAVETWTALIFTDVADPLDPNNPIYGEGDEYWIDNVVIKPMETQDEILETRSFGDAAGKMEQTITFDGFTELVTVREFDNYGRLVKEYLPIQRGAPPPQDFFNQVLVISELDLSADGIQTDYATLLEAHTDLVERTSHLSISDIGKTTLELYVVVAVEGDLAPVGVGPGDIVGLKTLEGVGISLDIKGIVKGTAAYDELKSLAGSEQKAPVSSEISTGLYIGDLAGHLEKTYGTGENPWREYEYPSPGESTLMARSLPGAGYNLDSRKLKSGAGLLATPVIPDNPELISSEGGSLVEAPYTYSWNRDPQGNYSINIKDEQGRDVYSGVNKNPNPSGSADWKLSINIYDDFSRLETSISPELKITGYNYDGRGQVVQVEDPDRETSHFLYDSLGQARFSRTEGQAYFLATKYDAQGRPLGTAKDDNLSAMTSDNANTPSYPPGLLEEGTVYDELTATEFLVRTSFQAGDIGAPLSELRNTQGKVVMSYKLNEEPTPPIAGLDARTRLSASFYSYDDRGRLSAVFKYIGSAPSGHRWHKIKYEYEPFWDRLQSRTVYTDAAESAVSSKTSYLYDEHGRISEVLDETDSANPKVMAVYFYDFRGRTDKVSLYGRFTMDYAYDIQGKTRGMEGYTIGGGNVFSQYLGYEGEVHDKFPESGATPPSRFDGKISSSLMKYSSLAPSPIEYRTYAYQPDGPLSETNRFKGDDTMLKNGRIDFTKLGVFVPASQDEKDGYQYYEDGGIRQKTVDNADPVDDVVLNYQYVTGKHRLSQVERVEGGVTKTASFTYDEEGRMKSQNGINPKTIEYNFSGLPVKMEADGKAFHFFYDENNYRVATWVEESGTITSKKAYIYEDGLKVAKEIRDDGSSVKTLVHLYGRAGLIGVMDEETKERRLMVKDHQGSVVQVIDEETGQPLDQTFYADYGEPKKKVNSSDPLNPSEGYTGKEFNEDLSLTYFGARFFDPTFGVWITPDPAGQFFNPYSYGGDPINGVDSDGECIDGISTLLCVAIAAAYIGAGVGAYKAAQAGYFNKDEWWKAGLYIVGGAAVGGVSGYAGAVAATAATGAAGFAAAGHSSNLIAVNSGFLAATAGGAAGAATANSLNFAGNYLLDATIGGKQGSAAGFFGGIFKSGVYGGITGGVIGGLSYAASDAVQWKTHETVFKYAANKAEPVYLPDGSIAFYRNKEAINRALDYAALQEGIDPKTVSYVRRLPKYKGQHVQARTGAVNGGVEVSTRGITNRGRSFDASNLYETVWHEGGHQNFIEYPSYKQHGLDNFILHRNAQHARIYQMEIQHRYFQYWSPSVRDAAVKNFYNYSDYQGAAAILGY